VKKKKAEKILKYKELTIEMECKNRSGTSNNKGKGQGKTFSNQSENTWAT
jgi:hypothetical protein